MISQVRNRIDGLLLIDKPEGITSHDVVDEVRRLLRIKKVGHTGTLDPFATGLLVLCLGKATRLSEYITKYDKEYLAIFYLGKETSTDDAEGEVVSQVSGEVIGNLSTSDVKKTLSSFTGIFYQLPPSYSAIKVKGKKAYEEARKGSKIKLQSRKVTVYELEVLNYDLPEVKCRISCSSGTYIRALARDVGRNLRCGGHLSSLRRIRIGNFFLKDAITLGELEKLVKTEDLSEKILSMSLAVNHLLEIRVTTSGLSMLSQGKRLGQEQVLTNLTDITVEDLVDSNITVRIPDLDGKLAVIGTLQRTAEGKMILKPDKVFMRNDLFYRE